MKKPVLFILCLLFLNSCMNKQNPYIEDLNFIYKAISENHPGVYNDQDYEFNKNLKESYSKAKGKIIDAKNFYSSKEAISIFTKSFNDNHLWVSWSNDSKKLNIDILRKFSVSRLSNNIAWVTLPTFDLDIRQEKDFYQLIKDITELQFTKYIIFDLRGNQGGNSEYGSKVVDALFTEEYTHQTKCLFNKKVYVDWRASEDNLNHISSLLVKYPNSWLQEIEYGLKESIKQSKNYYREFSSQTCGLKNDLRKVPMLSTKVIIVIDSSNVSAALDFIDELKMVTTNIMLIGQTTKADRLYMEVRSLPLPSGFGSFSFPIKVYRNRNRLDNQPYVPDIKQGVSNTEALQRFILTKIKEGGL